MKPKAISVKIAAPLHNIAERWRIFYFHSYLTVALQSFVVAITHTLRNHPGGLDRARLL